MNGDDEHKLEERLPERYPWESLRSEISRLMQHCHDEDKLLILDLLRVEIQHDLLSEQRRRLWEETVVRVGQVVQEPLGPTPTAHEVFEAAVRRARKQGGQI